MVSKIQSIELFGIEKLVVLVADGS